MNMQAHLYDHMHVKFFCVEPNSFIEIRTLAIIEVHCYINLQDKFGKS